MKHAQFPARVIIGGKPTGAAFHAALEPDGVPPQVKRRWLGACEVLFERRGVGDGVPPQVKRRWMGACEVLFERRGVGDGVPLQGVDR